MLSRNINFVVSVIEKKEYIDTILLQNNFYRDYVEGGGWGPCHDNFFEVWKKVNLN
jgi:hypothetical protein